MVLESRRRAEGLGESEGAVTPRQRIVTHMSKHPWITLRELAVVAGISLADVKTTSFARLIYKLRDDGIVQTSTNGLRSVFTHEPLQTRSA